MSENKTFYDIQLFNNNKSLCFEEFLGSPVRPSMTIEEQAADDGSWTLIPNSQSWNAYEITLKKFDYSQSINRVEITAYSEKKIETWELYDIIDVNIVTLDEDALQVKLTFNSVNFFANT